MDNKFAALSLLDDDENPEEVIVYTPPRGQVSASAVRRARSAAVAARARDDAQWSEDRSGVDTICPNEVDVDDAAARSDSVEAQRAGADHLSVGSGLGAGAASESSGSGPRARPRRKLGAGALLWLDLEMTGLDPTRDEILELACVLTDKDLTRVIDGPEVVVSHPEEVLARMNEWCVKQHGESGLTQRVRESITSLREAEEAVVRFLDEYTTMDTVSLAGNAVYKDKEFLDRHMPALAERIHWRVVDVSTINEIAHRWFPAVLRKKPRKKQGHRAKQDVYESIDELRFYQKSLFRQPAPAGAKKR
mmetsp:Transcript_23038/g.62544  ORF Transcript_23038/g.62544 Transcript_23038/m.62544 type:complete len:306 (-) Transcript_23038:211-1128(-)